MSDGFADRCLTTSLERRSISDFQWLHRIHRMDVDRGGRTRLLHRLRSNDLDGYYIIVISSYNDR